MPEIAPSSDGIASAPARSFREAIKWSYVMDGGRQFFTTLITFLLARLLGPEAFGVAAMALAYVFFMQMLQSQGLAAALIQRKELHRDHLDAAFWALLVVSLTLVSASILLAGWWSSVNDVPALRNVVIVLSLTIPLQGLVIVQESILRREMDFRSLAIRTNVAVVTAGLVAIGLALGGAGVWALVFQQLTSSLIGLLVLWKMSSWRPRWRMQGESLRELLGFSTLSFAATIAVFIGNRSDALLVGVFFGPTAAGLYYFSARLVTMSVDLAARALQGAALPEFSRNQRDLGLVAERMKSVLSMSAMVAIPMLAIIAGSSEEIVGLLGDEEWGPASAVLRILVLVGVVRSLTLFTGPLLQSLGRPGQHAGLSWLTALLSASAFVGSGLVLADRGLEEQVVGLALSRAGVHVVILVAYLVPVVRVLDLNVGAVIRSVLPGIGLGLIGFLVIVSVRVVLPTMVVVRLLIEVSLALMAMGVLLVWIEPRARLIVARTPWNLIGIGSLKRRS